MATDNTPTAYEALGPTLPLTFGARPEPKKRPKVSPKTKRIISELGLRYRPAAATDLEAHAAMLALLMVDVADIPPHLLERAAIDWVKESRFMPKVAELIEKARSYVESGPLGSITKDQIRAHVDWLNGLNWVIDSGKPYFVKELGDGRIAWARTV